MAESRIANAAHDGGDRRVLFGEVCFKTVEERIGGRLRQGTEMPSDADPPIGCHVGEQVTNEAVDPSLQVDPKPPTADRVAVHRQNPERIPQTGQ